MARGQKENVTMVAVSSDLQAKIFQIPLQVQNGLNLMEAVKIQDWLSQNPSS